MAEGGGAFPILDMEGEDDSSGMYDLTLKCKYDLPTVFYLKFISSCMIRNFD